MTTFATVEKSKEVTDVLFSIISGDDTVKAIVKNLKQPQPTVSAKIKFLVENNVINKDKWSFSPNWKSITKISQKEAVKYFDEYLGILKSFDEYKVQNSIDYNAKIKRENEVHLKKLDTIIKNIYNIFSEKRVTLIFFTYTELIPWRVLENKSIHDIIFDYLATMKATDVKKLNKDFVPIKQFFSTSGISTMEELLFEEVEKYFVEANKTRRKIRDAERI